MAEAKICAVEGCGKKHFCRGYCVSHYRRSVSHGNPICGRTGHGEPLRFIHDVALNHTGPECLKWPYTTTRHGYGTLRIGRRRSTASRYVCELVHGAPPTKEHQAAHSCGKGHEGCISPVHLRWATPDENAADKIEHGTYTSGEGHIFSKLTWDNVDAIRSLRGKRSHADIAREFGVSRATISMIMVGKTWA